MLRHARKGNELSPAQPHVLRSFFSTALSALPLCILQHSLDVGMPYQNLAQGVLVPVWLEFMCTFWP